MYPGYQPAQPALEDHEEGLDYLEQMLESEESSNREEQIGAGSGDELPDAERETFDRAETSASTAALTTNGAGSAGRVLRDRATIQKPAKYR